MHDLGLGGPVEVDRDPEAKHSGPCFDGVYGCHKCWNAANNGKGEISTCEGCRADEVHTKIIRASDEPVLYAACEACQRRSEAAHREAQLDWYAYLDDIGYDEDDIDA